MVTIENVSPLRAVWSFQLPGAGADGGPSGLLVIGDPIDADGAKHLVGVPRSGLCPSPIVKLTAAEWEELGVSNHAAIRNLEDLGELKVTGAPAEAS